MIPNRCSECRWSPRGENSACHGCHGWAHFDPLPPNDGTRRCGTCRHFDFGAGSDEHCEGCTGPNYAHWHTGRDPLTDDELLGCDDPTLLSRAELERLVGLLREELTDLKAQSAPSPSAERAR